MNKKKLITIVVVIIALIAGYRLVLFVQKKIAARQEAQKISVLKIPVRAIAAKKSDLIQKLRLTGDIKGIEVVNVFPQVGGKIEQILVKEGDRVYRGQTIMTINRDIVGMQYLPAIVDSPINGYVGNIVVDRGMTVSQTMPLGQIVNMDSVEAIVNLIEENINRVSIGMEAEIAVDAFRDKVFKGKVYKKSATLDASSRTQQVNLAIQNNNLELKHGMFATISIVTETKKNVTNIPVDAIADDMDGTLYVFTVVDNRAVKKIIKTGLRVDRLVEITGGLEEGDVVITLGRENVKEGSLLIVYRDDEPAVKTDAKAVEKMEKEKVAPAAKDKKNEAPKIDGERGREGEVVK